MKENMFILDDVSRCGNLCQYAEKKRIDPCFFVIDSDPAFVIKSAEDWVRTDNDKFYEFTGYYWIRHHSKLSSLHSLFTDRLKINSEDVDGKCFEFHLSGSVGLLLRKFHLLFFLLSSYRPKLLLLDQNLHMKHDLIRYISSCRDVLDFKFSVVHQ